MSTGSRILVAGFQHETNTFAPTKADWSYFENGAMFPAFSSGESMILGRQRESLPISGFISEARALNWTLVPSCWAGGGASAQILNQVYEKIAAHILRDIEEALHTGLDAIYLDLHGAAVTEDIDDPEGDLLTRIRAEVGQEMPIVASLDLHANVSDEMLQRADTLVGYRTYPHIDMFATGARAARALARQLKEGKRLPASSARVPFLIPITLQDTTTMPAAAVYRFLLELERRHDVSLEFTMGFPTADIAACGPRVWGYGHSAAVAVDELLEFISEPRERWRISTLSPRSAVAQAMDKAANADGPVVIADTQDNPGGGADSNTTGMLQALLAEGAGIRFPGKVALGLVFDPEAARKAHEAGVSAVFHVTLGKRVQTFTGEMSDEPVQALCTVRALSSGRIRLKGAMSMGGWVDLGPSACLEVKGCLVLVVSGKMQLLDREMYREFGIQPEMMKVLVNKSSVHFRADFAPIASHILVAKASGPLAADPAELPWKKLPRDIQARP